MKIPSLLATAGAALALLLSGCSSPITNLTLRQVPVNASGIYDFSFRARLDTPGIMAETVEAFLVINGQEVRMDRNPSQSRLFEVEYRMPEGQAEARYYYAVRYQFQRDGFTRKGEVFSDFFVVRLINRYVLQLLTDRGPVGTEVAVVGSGFSSFDTVIFGGVEVPTRVGNANSLTFTVPAVPAGQSYPVALRTNSSELDVGLFRVDQAQLTVTPGSLELMRGQRRTVVVQVPFAAPGGGLPVTVTTDVATSVIMPEIVIPAGARSVNVPVEGGDAGFGTLYFSAPGFGEVQIPVAVR